MKRIGAAASSSVRVIGGSFRELGWAGLRFPYAICLLGYRLVLLGLAAAPLGTLCSGPTRRSLMAKLKTEDQLFGLRVITHDGAELGKVQDVEIETEGWRLTGLVVRLERDVLERLRMRKPLIGTQEMLVSVADVVGVSDNVVLSRPLGDYARAPGEEPNEASGPE